MVHINDLVPGKQYKVVTPADDVLERVTFSNLVNFPEDKGGGVRHCLVVHHTKAYDDETGDSAEETTPIRVSKESYFEELKGQ